jgi:hypothetical protein
MTAKGDLLVGTGSGTTDKLTVGTNSHVLTADSTTATGLKWAASPSGGKVLQVVNMTSSTQSNHSSTSYTDTNMTLAITPSATSSKILILANAMCYLYSNDGKSTDLFMNIVRGSTDIISTGTNQGMTLGGTAGIGVTPNAYTEWYSISTFAYLDSPSTTSSTTYKVQARLGRTTGGSNGAVGNYGKQSLTLMEIGA